MRWIFHSLRHAGDIRHRAPLREMWAFLLIWLPVSLVFLNLARWAMMDFYAVRPQGFFDVIIFALCLGPLLALCVRRLHDLNRSGTWLLVAFVPAFGLVGLAAVLLTIKGSANSNTYGPSPVDGYASIWPPPPNVAPTVPVPDVRLEKRG